jgi:hypothetical protein
MTDDRRARLVDTTRSVAQHVKQADRGEQRVGLNRSRPRPTLAVWSTSRCAGASLTSMILGQMLSTKFLVSRPAGGAAKSAQASNGSPLASEPSLGPGPVAGPD